MDSLHYSRRRMIYAIYRVYKVLPQPRRLRYYHCALIMNGLKITLSIVSVLPPVCAYISYLLYYYYNPSTFDLSLKTSVKIISRRYRLFRLGRCKTLVISRPRRMFRVFFLVLRLMHSESVEKPSLPLIPLLLLAFLCPLGQLLEESRRRRWRNFRRVSIGT